nr:ABC transporter permease [Pullulanibacillus pueri]
MKFLTHRVLLMIPTLIGVSIIVFLMLQIVPGDPVDSIVPVDASKEVRAQITEQLGLNHPLYIQYVDWLMRSLHGDFGQSIVRQLSVNALLFPALLNTLILALGAGIFAFVISLVIGVYSAYKPKSWLASIGNLIGLTGISIPNFWAALILIGIFSVLFGWLPPIGMKSSVNGGSFADVFYHIIMPAVAAGMTTLGVMTRMVRSAVFDLLHQDFVQTLQAKGLKPFRILLHVLKNATPNLLTVAGLQLGYLIGGSVLVETVFAWPGIGQLIYQSVSQRDYPIIQAGVLIVSVIFILLNLIVDLLHSIIDPRVRGS